VPPLELVQDSDDSCIKKELKGAQDVQYEPRGGLDKKNGRKEWIPVMVSSQGTNGEYSTE